MINSLLVANNLYYLIPVEQRTEFTTNYEFFSSHELVGPIEKTVIDYIIPDHEKNNYGNKRP